MTGAVHRVASAAGRAVAEVMVLAVRLYQLTLGAILGGHCRFVPSCSQYAIEALREHGPLRGAGMVVWRILRCHPWGRGGHDPVPPRRHGEC